MPTIWRLQTKTEGKIENIGNYCFKNKIIAMGWGLYYEQDGIRTVSDEERKAIGNDFKKFEEAWKKHDEYLIGLGDSLKEKNAIYKSIDSVKRLAEMKTGDLVWMRIDGIYYIGRVGEGSEWSFVADAYTTEMDACNQRSNIEWYKVGNESEVPGAINTAFIRGSTFQRIHLDGAKEYSSLCFDKLARTTHYEAYRPERTQNVFFNMLSPSDAEDLLCLWLYKEHRYICIPSTNKISTPLYECVLLDTKNGKIFFVQVRKGDKSIDIKNYIELSDAGEVYLLQTNDKYENLEMVGDFPGKITIVQPKALFDFAMDRNNKNFLSPAIRKWVDYLD